MRIIGIDFGTKRIGIAVSDELQMLARELTILAPAVFWQSVPDLIAEYEAEKIVVGLPLGMAGNKTKKTEEVEAFVAKLQQTVAVPVILIDERLSSQMAAHLPGGQTNVDSLAAQIILQNYLNKNSSML